MKTGKLLLTYFFTCMVFWTVAKGADKTEERNVGSFKGIKVSSGIDLFITMGETEKVTIVADDDIIDEIKTEVKGDVLSIYIKQNNWFNWSGNHTRKAYVTVKELREIDASAGSDVKSENTLKGEDLKINTSSGSDVEVDVYYKNILLNSSSGSDSKITGKAKTLEAVSSSGSDIDAGGLESKICKVTVSSGADATVNVTDELYANASSGGDVKYYGNPAVVDSNESSGGDVSKK